MGTSISQGSPTGNGAENWKELSSDLSKGLPPDKVVERIVGAYRSQYGDETKTILVDKGVLSVENFLQNFPLKGVSNQDCIAFMIEAKKMIAAKGENSFFTEMAITSACAAILKPQEDLKEQFKKNYLTSIADYIVSRDQIKILGGQSIPNLYSKQNYLDEVKAHINSLKTSNKSLKDLMGLQND